MKLNPVVWDQVTGLSQLMAIVLFVGVFALGFLLGKTYEYHAFTNAQKAAGTEMTGPAPVADVTFACDAKKTMEGVFFNGKVTLLLSDGRSMSLPQVISGSGARYANADESFVFWNKGDTAFVEEGKDTTYANCVVKK